jgi:hypothetical protein
MKRGDKVWVEATVERVYRDYLGQNWVGVSVDGGQDVLHVEDSLIKPREEPATGNWVDQLFGGMPAGTVEVDVHRYLELPDDKRAMIRTIDPQAEPGQTERYFEVTG